MPFLSRFVELIEYFESEEYQIVEIEKVVFALKLKVLFYYEIERLLVVRARKPRRGCLTRRVAEIRYIAVFAFIRSDGVQTMFIAEIL